MVNMIRKSINEHYNVSFEEDIILPLARRATKITVSAINMDPRGLPIALGNDG